MTALICSYPCGSTTLRPETFFLGVGPLSSVVTFLIRNKRLECALTGTARYYIWEDERSKSTIPALFVATILWQ